MNETEKALMEHGYIFEYKQDRIELIPSPLHPENTEVWLRPSDIILNTYSEDWLVNIDNDLLDVLILLKQLRSEQKAGLDTASRINRQLAIDQQLLKVQRITQEAVFLNKPYGGYQFLLANGIASFHYPHTEDIRRLVWNDESPALFDLFEQEMTADSSGCWRTEPVPSEHFSFAFCAEYRDSLTSLLSEDQSQCGFTVRLYADEEIYREYNWSDYNIEYDIIKLDSYRHTSVSLEVQFHGLFTKQNYRDYYDLHMYLIH
ncbi:MAG: hypothetical protein IKG46_08415 [Solobacterium sp.]|nr:hypothetical protein [Solobacterium sp.]